MGGSVENPAGPVTLKPGRNLPAAGVVVEEGRGGSCCYLPVLLLLRRLRPPSRRACGADGAGAVVGGVVGGVGAVARAGGWGWA